ncbi:MAG: hypothetical protein L3J97_07625, partial [Thermoplasmata archaeon]|nr:hypothetical protein [Thermoplasmata archaeon]
SRLVEVRSGIPLAANKALVGYNSFSHEAGIHTHGILANTLTYEPIQPEAIGRTRKMILGKHTGSAAVVEKLKEREAVASAPALAELLQKIKRGTEQEGKGASEGFLQDYRTRFEHPGISDAMFWRLAKESGVTWSGA